MNFSANVTTYLNGRTPDARYASFDYCFNYFQAFHEAGRESALLESEFIELSCLQLGFYLASWGMLRGSAEMLQKSARSLVPVIKLIARADTALWEIDAHSYTDANIRLLMETRDLFRKASPSMSDILFTKIMLGVFGNVPAFDINFKRGFGCSTFGPKALQRIGAFYQDKRVAIDQRRAKTLDFVTGEATSRKYSRAKVIDMA